jgi:hypothetical protein
MTISNMAYPSSNQPPIAIIGKKTELHPDTASSRYLSPEANNRGVLTLAFGKPLYIEMAKSLARSLILHDPKLKRAVVTDSDDPDLHQLFSVVIPYRPEYGNNVRQKMHLDLYSPFEETLFIDSDSLILRSLDSIWEAFRNVDFGATANQTTLSKGFKDEYMDVDFILSKFGLEGIPKFNGGLYYFNSRSHAVSDTARSLLKDYVSLRFTEFRNDGPADEPLYQVAMAIHGLQSTDMGKGGMWTPIKAVGKIKLDIVNGVCQFTKIIGSPPTPRLVEPEVMHFATFTDSVMYRRECLKLLKNANGHSPETSLAEELALRAPVLRLFVSRKLRGIRRHAINAIRRRRKS